MIASVILGLFACHCSSPFGPGDDDDDDDELSLLDVCSGTYECSVVRDPDVRAELTFSRRANSCYLWDVRLDEYELIITGDTHSFRMCDVDSCLDCYRKVPATPGSSRCTGTANSCSSIGASSCAWQSGCQYRVGVNTASTSDDDCGGTPNACSEMDSQERCDTQEGCQWQ